MRQTFFYAIYVRDLQRFQQVFRDCDVSHGTFRALILVLNHSR
jgi:hypothetical protein